MKNTRTSSQYAALILMFIILSGCKIMEDDNSNEMSFAGLGSRDAAPAIWGKPASDTLVNSQYAFTPEAADADGDVLTFSIVNKPGWASFDTTSGRLHGIPRSEHVGEHRGIVISVSDDNSVISLPGFSVTVSPTPVQDEGSEGDATPSDPPTISGKPNQAAVVGDVYAFQPQAGDTDGDVLSFSIVNKPSWANFNTVSGRLKGTPTTSDLGEGNPIELSVTDGTSVAALTPFTITVEAAGPSSYTLSWVAPTENEDGTALTDLAGYRIYYGTAPDEYTETIEINSPGVTTYMIGNLTPGTYFLVMTSVNSRDMESRHSSELEFEPTT